MMSMGTIAEIANDLLKNEYYVLNLMAKYYVVAFALNFTRLEIYSKDCDKEIISWPTDVDNEMTDSIAGEGPIKGIIDDGQIKYLIYTTFCKKLETCPK